VLCCRGRYFSELPRFLPTANATLTCSHLLVIIPNIIARYVDCELSHCTAPAISSRPAFILRTRLHIRCELQRASSRTAVSESTPLGYDGRRPSEVNPSDRKRCNGSGRAVEISRKVLSWSRQITTGKGFLRAHLEERQTLTRKYLPLARHAAHLRITRR
jgi:hypothetical protein